MTKVTTRKRKLKSVYEYKGCVIFRNFSPGHALRLTARTSNGQVAANSLRDIKQLISEVHS